MLMRFKKLGFDNKLTFNGDITASAMRVYIVCGVLLLIQIILADPAEDNWRERLHRHHNHRGPLRRIVHAFRRLFKEKSDRKINAPATIGHKSRENLELYKLPQTESPRKETTNVSISSFAAFVGDRCATGYVKINGICVDRDY